MAMIVDPYLLSIPVQEDFDSQKSMEYVKQLQKWEVEFIKNPKKYTVSHAALSTMQRLGLSPTPDNLNAYWKKYGITEVSYQDIAPTCAGVLANSDRLEDMDGVYDAFCEVEIIEGRETVIPEEIRLRMHPEVAAEFIHSLIYAAYTFKRSGKKNGWSIVTAPIHNEDPTSCLTTEALLSALKEDASLEEVEISYEWPLLFDPEHIYASLEISDIFRTFEIYEVVEVARCRLNRQGNKLPRIDYSKIRFQRRFLESILEPKILRRPGFKEDVSRIFEGIVFSVLNVWSYGCDKHHTLNKIVTLRNSEERTRKSRSDSSRRDKGARIEALGGNTPLHVHYWRCVDGTFEFSNVTDEHDDPTIYE